MKWTMQRIVALVIAILAFSALESFVVTEAVDSPTRQQVSQLVQNNAISAAQQQQLAQTQAQQAAIFNSVLAKFFAEQSFLCRASVAHNATLGGPPAPPGICDVELPTPKP